MTVTLRPVEPHDLDVFDAEFQGQDGAGAHQWFGYRNPVAPRRRLAEDGMLGEEGGVLTICDSDEVAGRIEWSKLLWGPPGTSWCWAIGIRVLAGFRGRGIGTEAHRQVVAYLFDHTRAQRIQANTDVANVAEQRTLEKAGFTREGVVRQAQWREGRWHDQVLYGITRDDHQQR
ncbi:GNAT family N-acetyltransferase [Nonomuraea soli]|uniref:Aminoglycoside 6'-N-acetyltransferase n=1 Tax=Nonomuraea soli TaxID=1032476 RepID=A0A7W0CTF8_9ACTN|nr:GNAT family protein [Nonomuraea soli]MBA2897034.1 aminoglycoside 6'-N-acetyltransferase [Nonomuraea soli]